MFPTSLAERAWVEFPAAGFARPVAGAIYRGSNPPVCGLPLGGIDTGCLDLEATGLLGFSTVFNMLVPRRGPINQPFLGLAVGERTWVLTTLDLRCRRGEVALGPVYGPTSPVSKIHPRSDILVAEEIEYWGHYPVADLEYRISAPVQVGLRAWAPFVPGDVAASNTPGAVFEVHLRNASAEEQSGTVAFSFPGPSEEEAGSAVSRQELGEPKGILVSAEKAAYVLAVIGAETPRCGGALGVDAGSWGHIRHGLPAALAEPGCSLAVDFTLAPGEQKAVRFVLAWYSPVWKGAGRPGANQRTFKYFKSFTAEEKARYGDTMPAGGHSFYHMYAARYGNAVEVARYLAENHASLLRRILAWQAVVLSDAQLPIWLRSDLVNYLHLITEDSLWAQARPPIGEWCRAEDGVFGMIESPRWCPQVECIPCSFTGNIPLVYFFPELALSTLRAYKAYQYHDGQAPWFFGGNEFAPYYLEMAMPIRGYRGKPQTTLAGPCYVDMVDRMWLRTGDPALLREFYESVKQNTIFTMNLRPGSGAAGIVSMPAGNLGQDWYESCDLFGIVPHIGGVHLAQLRMAGRMAEAMGDQAFAAQCQEWLEQGSEVMEEHTWAGSHYMLFNELESGKRSDIIMSYMLDGEWMARFHGLAGVFRPERVATTLQTIRKTSVALSEYGPVVFCNPDGSALGEGEWDPGYHGRYGVRSVYTFMLAMTYMYNDESKTGMEITRRCLTAMMEQGWTWDLTQLFDGRTCARRGAFDSYMNMMLWSLPAAMEGGDLTGPCQAGGLVDRILKAARTGAS